MAAETPEKTSGLSTRGAMIAGAGVVVLLILAVFTGVFLIPFLQTRAAVHGFRDDEYSYRLRQRIDVNTADYDAWVRSLLTTYPRSRVTGVFAGGASGYVTGESAVERLGGPARTADRLRTYLRMPGWLARDKPAAVRLLGFCDESAAGSLTEALKHERVEIRIEAALALETNHAATAASVEAILRAASDPDANVRSAAIQALAEVTPRTEEIINAIKHALKDENAFVRHAARTVPLPSATPTP